MKEWITEANPLKEASTFEIMEASRNSKNGQLQVMFWKKNEEICLYKNLILKIDLIKITCSEKIQYPEKKLKLN